MKNKRSLVILAVLALSLFVASVALAAHLSPVNSHGFGMTALKGGNGGGGGNGGNGGGGNGPGDGSGYGPGGGSGVCDGTGPKGPGARNDKN